jgi:putative resolvase
VSNYNIAEFAKVIGVTVKTLQRWDREGRLVPLRSPGNRRLYTGDHLKQVLGEKVEKKGQHRLKVGYCRVSSNNQRSDLVNQRRVLGEFCDQRTLSIDEWIEEVGGGLNFRRPKFLALLERILRGEVELVVIAHKDRLARFGFDLLEYLGQRSGCDILVMNSEQLSPQEEMVQDLLTIVHTFSARLYGLRNYKKKLQEALALDQDTSDQAQSNP